MAAYAQQKTVVVGAGPVGALAALYAARRGDAVEIYELRDGEFCCACCLLCSVWLSELAAALLHLCAWALHCLLVETEINRRSRI